MKITSSENNKFKPYTITIEVESQQDHELLSAMAYADGSIPEVLCNKRSIPVERTKQFLRDLMKLIYNKR